MDMKIDVCAIPLAASKKITFEMQEMQSNAIQQIQTLGKDLFTPNKAIMSETDSKRCIRQQIYIQRVCHLKSLFRC